MSGFSCHVRRQGERVIVGSEATGFVEIVVNEIDGKQASLCIRAPMTMEIKRPGKEQDAHDRQAWFERRRQKR